jgi:hypothetical protein
VNVRLEREGEIADVLVERYGTWSLACRAPCTFDASPGEHLRIGVLGADHEPLAFTVPADASAAHDVDIDIGRQGRGALIAGLAMIAGGAVSLALGMAIIRGAGDDDLFGDANRWVGRVGLLLGGASVVTGGVLIITRSTAPVILPSPTTRSQAHDDLGPTRATSSGSSIPLRLAPVQVVWTLRF